MLRVNAGVSPACFSSSTGEEKAQAGKRAGITDASDGVAVCLECDACGDPVRLGAGPAGREACGGQPGLGECHSCRKPSLR